MFHALRCFFFYVFSFSKTRKDVRNRDDVLLYFGYTRSFNHPEVN